MRLRLYAAAVLGCAVIPTLATPPVSLADGAPAANLGKKIANFTLADARGKALSLYDLKDKKAIVLVFLSFECPVSTSYCQPLADMAGEFGKYGVAFVGLAPNAEETAAQLAKQARDYNLPFPVLKDAGLKAADALRARVTPEAFVLDGDFVLRYRGRIDNSYYARLKKNAQVTREDLKQVLGELLSGRPVSVASTEAVGCTIRRDAPGTAKAAAVTYYRDVLPILQNRCQNCHRPGEVGPFSLMTYRQAVNWAGDIKEYTQTRRMPPWKPVDGPAFHNERKLTDRQIATLAAWVDGGTPEGDRADAPPPQDFPKGWQLGTPDLVLTVPDDFQLGPTGRDVFRCFVLPTHLGEDKYIGAVEVRPGNPRIVHHTLLFIDQAGQGRKLEERATKQPAANPPDEHAPGPLDRGPGYSVAMGVGFQPQGGLSGWAPGQMPRYLPTGTGYFLPKNSDIVMQVHYHRNGRLEKDRTSVGLYFVKEPKARQYQGAVIAGSAGGQGLLRLFFAIPAGAERFPLKGSLWARGDCTLYSIMPHMHLLGKEIRVALTPPDGPARTLVAIREWDYNWQETYWFREPVAIKAGSRLEVEAVYDNSAGNPNNPFNPPLTVTFGEQTTNEMCFVFLGGLSAGGGRRLPLSATPPERIGAKAAAKE
jgi:peroxiredoxin